MLYIEEARKNICNHPVTLFFKNYCSNENKDFSECEKKVTLKLSQKFTFC